GRYAGALAASLHGIIAESACGSCAIPPGPITHASDGRRSDVAVPRAPECAAGPRHRLHDGCDSAPMSGSRPGSCMPAAFSPRAPHTHEPRPAVWRWVSPFSAVDVPQNGVVEHRLRQQLLQPRVLILECL